MVGKFGYNVVFDFHVIPFTREQKEYQTEFEWA